MLVTDSGTVLRMCGRAVALVCILFLSASALVTRSSLPSPRARVCTFRCVRVYIGIQDISPASSTRRSSCSSWPVTSFPFPAYLLVLPLPFVFHSSRPSTSLRSSLYRPHSFVVGCLSTAIRRFLLCSPLGCVVFSFLPTRLVSFLTMCTFTSESLPGSHIPFGLHAL